MSRSPLRSRSACTSAARTTRPRSAAPPRRSSTRPRSRSPSRLRRTTTRAPGRPTATTTRASTSRRTTTARPYKRLWTIDAHDTIEFPPVGRLRPRLRRAAEGPLPRAQRGERPGRWRKSLGRCAASSPTIGKGVVYQAYMHRVECVQGQSGRGRLRRRLGRAHGPRALALQDGARRVLAAPSRQAALLRRLGQRRPRDQRGDWPPHLALPGGQRGEHLRGLLARPHLHRVGQRHALLAQRQEREAALERARPGRGEFWYATPTVAYGRVYIGNTDGTMYVFGAKSGKLLWARPLGSYIYGAAAVYRRKVFVGHLRRQVLRARRRHRRRALGHQRQRRGALGADRDGRARLLRGLLELRRGGPALGGARAGRDLRGPRRRRHARLALPGRASTRTRWSPTTTASTSPAARTSSRSPRRGRRRSRST